jgi:tRNA(Ile)-lysidine synthase
MTPGSAGEAVTPIEQAEFTDLMTDVEPFERAPHIAVACSGGGDSLALTLLLHDWATRRSGRLTALIVDHRLRPESASEVRKVRRWLRQRGIRHKVLVRPETPLTGNLQAAAREARYSLMSAWCAANGVLHLALGHHLEDQAETVLLRLARGSGVDGLAAMAKVSETNQVRYLRPMLGISSDRLRATLQVRRQPHIDDPSNENTDFRRVRLRRAQPILGAEGLTARRLAATAASMARARAALERAAAGCLARSATLYPEGYCLLDEGPLQAVPEEVALRCLARVVSCIGGRTYPPRLERVERLYDALMTEDGLRGGRTLAGCRIVRWRKKLLVCREARAATDVCPADAGGRWDDRFSVGQNGHPALQIRRLGADGWREAHQQCPELAKLSLPPAVRPGLPAFWDLDGVVYIPHFKYARPDPGLDPSAIPAVIFNPARPLTTAEFAMANWRING